MFQLKFKFLGIKKIITKKNNYKKFNKVEIFNKILINNKKSDLFFKYKFQKHKKNYESISKQVGACMLTGRNRSIINFCFLKRQIFKRACMENKIPLLVKKKKIIILFLFKKPNKFYLVNKVKNPFKKKNRIFIWKKNFGLAPMRSFILKYKNKFFSYTHNKFFFYKYAHVGNLFFFCNKFFIKKYFSIFSVFRYFFLKLKFYGKTFKWIFSKKKIRFKVQKAHKTFILFKNLKFKKKKKFKFKLRLYWLGDKKKFINSVKKIKYINLFTKKGLRILKTKLFKKKGKVSGYM